MGRFLKMIIAANLVLAALVVFAWIGYAGWAGLPIDSRCMGFRKGWKIDEPAWLSPVVFQTVFLTLFAFRRHIGEPKVRLIIAGCSAWLLLFTLVLPILQSQVYGTDYYSFDRALWWYACLSGIAYALFGTASADDRPVLAFR